MKWTFAVALAGLAWSSHVIAARVPGMAPALEQGQAAPAVPRPFPGSAPSRPADPSANQPPAGGPSTSSPATSTAPPPVATRSTPTDPAPTGTPVYPAAEFIDAFDAGSGQRYYLYGTNTPYADIVTYYKNLLKNGGRELFKTPPMQQFDLGRYQEDAMAYPPSVVVKDYTWNGSTGYLAVVGTEEKRFKTIIQIVPSAAPAR